MIPWLLTWRSHGIHHVRWWLALLMRDGTELKSYDLPSAVDARGTSGGRYHIECEFTP